MTVAATSNVSAALGLRAFPSPPPRWPRRRRYAGTGVVIGNDVTTFTNELISGGAVTAYNAAGTPVNLQLRWAKIDSASLGSWTSGHLEPVLSDQHQRDRHDAGLGQRRHDFTFGSNGAWSSPSGSSITFPA